MICFLWCYNAKFNWKVLQAVFPNSIFPESNWRREISLPVNLLMANNFTLKPHSEQGTESAFVGKWEKELPWLLNMKPRSANALSFARLCVCCGVLLLGGSVLQPLSWDSPPAVQDVPKPALRARNWFSFYDLNPIWSGGFQPLNQGLRASPCQIVIHSLKPPHGPLFHPFPRGSSLDYVFYLAFPSLS